MEDYFKILGVQRDASLAEIKSAYRRLAFELHPDHNRTEGLNARFFAVNEAYKVLSDPLKRAEYQEAVADAITSDPRGFLKGLWNNIINDTKSKRGGYEMERIELSGQTAIDFEDALALFQSWKNIDPERWEDVVKEESQKLRCHIDALADLPSYMAMAMWGQVRFRGVEVPNLEGVLKGAYISKEFRSQLVDCGIPKKQIKKAAFLLFCLLNEAEIEIDAPELASGDLYAELEAKELD